MPRLDIELVHRGIVSSRARAQEAIRAGNVMVNGVLATKPSLIVDELTQLDCTQEALRYVSRAGRKLERALEEFSVDVQGKICVDLGASTGGFTDCLLQHGAKKVWAIDVGHDQLVASLRNDNRVVCLEGLDARDVEVSHIGAAVPLVATDVSFISLTYMFPTIQRILEPGGSSICLIKPQFEVGRELIGKQGVVKNQAARQEAIRSVTDAARTHGLIAKRVIQSPITGQQGNIEYLALFERECSL